MDFGEVFEKKMPKAIEYASHIIMETSNFIDFAYRTKIRKESHIVLCAFISPPDRLLLKQKNGVVSCKELMPVVFNMKS